MKTLAEYHPLGDIIFLIRSFDLLEDALDYGRELNSATRELTSHIAHSSSSFTNQFLNGKKWRSA